MAQVRSFVPIPYFESGYSTERLRDCIPCGLDSTVSNAEVLGYVDPFNALGSAKWIVPSTSVSRQPGASS